MKVAIRAVAHRVVAKRRKVLRACIKRDRQATSRIDLARQHLRDGCPTFLTRIPCFDDGIRVLLRPIHGQRAAIHQHHNQRFTGGCKRLQHLLLRSGQFNAGAVAAVESFDVHRHLLPFQLRRKSNERHHHVCLLCSLHCSLSLGIDCRHPVQRDACAEEPCLVCVLDANRMRLRVCKVQRERLQTA